MKKPLAVFLILACLAFTPAAHAADAKMELQDLVAKVKTKLQSGHATEADLAPEFGAFDALLTEHQGEKTDDVANILLVKALLYAQVYQDGPKATASLQQLKTNYPNTTPGKQADAAIAALARQAQGENVKRSLVVGTVFPGFQETDVDGKPLSVASEKGKVVLIDFWATWCGPCVQELPNVLKAYGQYHAKGFDIIGVSLDQDKAKLASFTKEKQMTWPQYCDGKGWESKLATTYGITSIPATYLLGRDGKIIGKDLRGDALEAAVKAALGTN